MAEETSERKIRYGLVSRITQATAGEIAAADLKEATEEEFYLSRVWRARNFLELALRQCLGKSFYSFKYNRCRAKA